MRNSTKRELYKLRELARFFMRDLCCFFCKKGLMPRSKCKAKDGDGRGSPIDPKITVHHVDGNHSNDRRSNKRLCHTRCHKRYNARIILQGRTRYKQPVGKVIVMRRAA